MTIFSYRKSRSMLHSLDSRCKIFAMCLLSIGCINTQFPGLFILYASIFIMMKSCGIKPINALAEIKYFLLLLVLIFISRSVITPGEAIFQIFGIHLSLEGIVDGALICLRFLAIMLLGILFSHTTSPSSIKGAVEWYLKPIPLVPEKKAALMTGLSIRFFPLILEQSQKISEAQKSRCSENSKNPVKKIFRLILPIFRKTFQKADTLAFAMESRCFSEDRTDPEFKKSGHEKIILISAILIFTILIFF